MTELINHYLAPHQIKYASKLAPYIDPPTACLHIMADAHNVIKVIYSSHKEYNDRSTRFLDPKNLCFDISLTQGRKLTG